MKTISLLRALALVLTVTTTALYAQVPQILNYQGRVAIGNPPVNFDGSGAFKFALVQGEGPTLLWKNDGSVGNTEPAAAVTLPVTKGLYSVLLGANMTPIPNTVFAYPDVRLRVWFNDGTANGSQLLTPDQRISAVGYAMMADNVTDGAITSAKIANGAVGSAQIGMGAVTSAKIAAGAVGATQLGVGAAALNLDASTGIVTTPGENPALVAAGYLRTGSLNIRAEGWTQSATKPGPFPREKAAAVWTGTEMLVWGGNNGRATNEGARYNPTTGTWTPMSKVNAPAARHGHRAIWTGTEMIVIGGLSSEEPPLNPTNGQTYSPGAVGGGRYNPTTDTWTLLPSAPRIYNHIAVWNGTDVLVLGGYGLSVGSGGQWLAVQNTVHSLYNPAANTFTPLSSPPGGVGAVTTNDLQRHSHSGIWSGSEFIVWGGARFAGNIRGWRWAPATNTWTVMAIPGAPSEAPGHTSIWTGSEMIIWGGGAGSRYNPGSNTWTPMSTTGVTNSVTDHTALWDGGQMNVISASGTHRYDPALNVWTTTAMTATSTKHVAVWTGTEMLAWGGAFAFVGNTGNRLHRYTPSSDTYVIEKLAPYGRKGHTAVWTGRNMIIFGGTGAGGLLGEPAVYSPASDEWGWLPFLGAPSARRDHSAVWTGTQMIIWGGHDGTNRLSDGARCADVNGFWSPITGGGAPAARSLHTAVWTGSRMLVWGGGDGTSKFANGSSWNPNNSWTPMNSMDAPSAREGHTMTWSGTEAVVWGGESASGGVATGARYNATTDTWSIMNTTNAPDARTAHTAILGGGEVIIYGGLSSAASTTPMNTGARYNLATDAWTTMIPDTFARHEHCAAWTGFDMIVWGGRDKTGYIGNGHRYSPVLNSSPPLPNAPTLTPRSGISAIWTGENAILYGGGDGTTFSSATMFYTPKLDLMFYTQP